MEKNNTKKVIVIGNGPSILRNEYGKKIDNYDIVIRVNCCPTKGFEKQIGQKTDIWATTKNISFKDCFYPENFQNLQSIWYRTISSKKYCKLPKNDLNNYIMYKNNNFIKHFSKYINKNNKFAMIGSNHEFCTGLLTILTATLFYDDVTVYGFDFYANINQDQNEIAYYRESQLNEDLTHYEDSNWAENIASGFMGPESRKIKLGIINDLVKKDKIKILQ